MRIGLISDTHIPRDAKELPPHVEEAFRGVNLILHAGDIYLPRILDELEKIAPVLAARGNGDRDFPEDHRLKEVHTLDIGGFRVGLAHAIPYPPPPLPPVPINIEGQFGGHADIVVFGDTHVAVVERQNGTLLVNPGSPTLPSGRFELGTVGLLEISEGMAEASIVDLRQFPLIFQKESIYYRGYGA